MEHYALAIAYGLGYFFGGLARWLTQDYGLALFWYVFTVPPLYRLLRRVGKSRWWAIFLVVPLFGFLFVTWIIALTRWPAVAPIKAA
jgi:hypothetical protein